VQLWLSPCRPTSFRTWTCVDNMISERQNALSSNSIYIPSRSQESTRFELARTLRRSSLRRTTVNSEIRALRTQKGPSLDCAQDYSRRHQAAGIVPWLAYSLVRSRMADRQRPRTLRASIYAINSQLSADRRSAVCGAFVRLGCLRCMTT
jgi:hypothetical protein